MARPAKRHVRSVRGNGPEKRAAVGGQRCEAEVEGVSQYLLDDVVGRARGHHEIDVGAFLTQILEDRGKQIHKRRRSGPEAYLGTALAPVPPHRSQRQMGLRLDPLGMQNSSVSLYQTFLPGISIFSVIASGRRLAAVIIPSAPEAAVTV